MAHNNAGTMQRLRRKLCECVSAAQQLDCNPADKAALVQAFQQCLLDLHPDADTPLAVPEAIFWDPLAQFGAHDQPPPGVLVVDDGAQSISGTDFDQLSCLSPLSGTFGNDKSEHSTPEQHQLQPEGNVDQGRPHHPNAQQPQAATAPPKHRLVLSLNDLVVKGKWYRLSVRVVSSETGVPEQLSVPARCTVQVRVLASEKSNSAHAPDISASVLETRGARVAISSQASVFVKFVDVSSNFGGKGARFEVTCIAEHAGEHLAVGQLCVKVWSRRASLDGARLGGEATALQANFPRIGLKYEAKFRELGIRSVAHMATVSLPSDHSSSLGASGFSFEEVVGHVRQPKGKLTESVLVEYIQRARQLVAQGLGDDKDDNQGDGNDDSDDQGEGAESDLPSPPPKRRRLQPAV